MFDFFPGAASLATIPITIPGGRPAGAQGGHPPVRDFRINQEIVWETVEQHLPPLKAEMERILEALPKR